MGLTFNENAPVYNANGAQIAGKFAALGLLSTGMLTEYNQFKKTGRKLNRKQEESIEKQLQDHLEWFGVQGNLLSVSGEVIIGFDYLSKYIQEHETTEGAYHLLEEHSPSLIELIFTDPKGTLKSIRDMVGMYTKFNKGLNGDDFYGLIKDVYMDVLQNTPIPQSVIDRKKELQEKQG